MNDKLVVYERIKEIAPREYWQPMSATDLEKAVKIAFEIIGHKPNEPIEYTVGKTKTNTKSVKLADFIFEVWELDSYG